MAFASFDNLIYIFDAVLAQGSHHQFSSSKSTGLESDCDGTGPVLGAFAQREPIEISINSTGRQPIAISPSLSLSRSPAIQYCCQCMSVCFHAFPLRPVQVYLTQVRLPLSATAPPTGQVAKTHFVMFQQASSNTLTWTHRNRTATFRIVAISFRILLGDFGQNPSKCSLV